MSGFQQLERSTKKPRRSHPRRRKMANFRNLRRFLDTQIQHKINQVHLRQHILHFHITQFMSGDYYSRKHFNLIRKYYEQALNLSTVETRAYSKVIDIDELTGFSTCTVSGLEDSDDDLEDIEEEEQEDQNLYTYASTPGDGESSQPRPTTPTGELSQQVWSASSDESLCLDFDPESIDVKIMECMGFEDKQQLEDYLNPPTLSSLNQNALQDAGEADIYDSSGFYIEENDYTSSFPLYDDDGDTVMKDDNQDSEEFNSLSIPTAQAAPNTTIPASIDSISSWVPPTMLEYNFSGASTSSQNNMVPTLDSGIHPSALQWGEPAPASRPSPFAPRPISAPLQALFLRVGVNPATRRTEKKVTLSDNQLAEARQRWEEQVVQQFTTLEEDTEDEKNYLDTWDFENRQFQWQTEGLFLCRLMEIKEQVTFREAKSAFQVAILKKPSKPHWTHPKGTRLPPSSLRNEIKWESTPENGNDTKSDKREDQ